MRLLAGALVAVLLLVLTGCGETTASDPEAEDTPTADPPTAQTSETDAAGPDESTEPSASPETSDDAPAGTTVTTGDSPFGPMLFDEGNQAIYIWELEPSSEPACYDDCARAWPPVLTEGEPVATGDVRPGLLGTTERRDGSLQVTYNDHPLYFYADEAPGEVKCHNVATHGGLWWVVQPDGNRAP